MILFLFFTAIQVFLFKWKLGIMPRASSKGVLWTFGRESGNQGIMELGIMPKVPGTPPHAKGIPSPKGCPWHGEGMPLALEHPFGRELENQEIRFRLQNPTLNRVLTAEDTNPKVPGTFGTTIHLFFTDFWPQVWCRKRFFSFLPQNSF